MLRYLGIFATVVGLALLSACGSPPAGSGPNGESPSPAFLTPVAAAREGGLTPYWLGDEVEGGGRTFRIIGARNEDGDEPLLARLNYHADFEGGGALSLRLATYGRGGWERDRDVVMPSSEGTLREDTTVRGWPAKVFTIPVGRWSNLLVIVDAPNGVVVARVTAAIDEGRQVNPLNDPDELLAVLEGLRPYPE